MSAPEPRPPPARPRPRAEATGGALAGRLVACGPVVDDAGSARAQEALASAAQRGEWRPALDAAWEALAPVFAASPYLAALAVRRPERLRRLLVAEPAACLQAILQDAAACAADADIEAAKGRLRGLKADLHLLTALCDLGGVWSLDEVTAALTRFADASVQSALAVVARSEMAKGRMTPGDGGAAAGPAPGLFCLALGKHGAFELNYSSDIDITVFYEPDVLPAAPGVEPQALALRLTHGLAALLQERTADGYVFRVDLRLRPDPSATPPALPVEAALDYYRTSGQNWERAAMIKARACAGDLDRAAAFLKELRPFIWRRSLDYAAIADIQSIKRQIHAHKVDERLSAPGANLKLGRGGIREIEFFVQTQQLILGGRDPSLRSTRTLDALAALERAGQVESAAAAELSAAYVQLRAWEHRVQMLADEQTHSLPESEPARTRVAALSGFGDLRAFDRTVSRTLRRVNARYAELFADEESLSSRFGSLVFTGVEDDPETLDTLTRMGFQQPAQVSAVIRGWHHGRIGATRSERGRELFTRLAPRLLEAAHATGAPNAAFNRFADFFARLSAGVQVQSLFLAEPRLFELVVLVMAFAPQLAATLARQPAALDSMLDPGFFSPLTPEHAAEAVRRGLAGASSFEEAMNAVRRAHREQAFRIGVQVMSGQGTAEEAGRAFAALADACIAALAPAAMAEVVRSGGAFPGDVAVVALGKAGSREMTARSDLDLMLLYRAAAPDVSSELKGWGAEAFYARFAQRLITALSAPTAEGELYTVDLRLRPSGKAGPVAVSLAAFETYYAGEAETWEHLALTRARVVWASSLEFEGRAASAIEAALRRPRDRGRTAADALEMRALLAQERGGAGTWDMKFHEGGLVDVEFAAQFLQIAHASAGGPLAVNTGDALQALEAADLAPQRDLRALHAAWSLQQALSQVVKLALAEGGSPDHEPTRFRALLARAGRSRRYPDLCRKLERAQARAHAAFERIVR